jgi:hypothetical protein
VSLWTATKKIRVGPKKNKVIKKKKTKEQVLAIQQKKTKKRLERKLKKLQPAPENKF